MKIIFFAMLFAISFSSNAQVKKVILQASGLTCSMCSNSINKSLKSLDFVEKVVANIKTSGFEVTFKPNSRVEFDLIKKKVLDAGFSIAKFTAIVEFDGQQVSSEDHLIINNTTYHFMNIKSQVLTGDKIIQILDKGFVPAKEYKKNAAFTKMECYKTGVTAACCSKVITATPGKRIYHVTVV
ncbi:MAG: heavy-metal-associated domain-containing protein [Ferruginibacter sp.]